MTQEIRPVSLKHPGQFYTKDTMDSFKNVNRGTSDHNVCQGFSNKGNTGISHLKFLKLFYTDAGCLSQPKNDERELYISNNSPGTSYSKRR